MWFWTDLALLEEIQGFTLPCCFLMYNSPSSLHQFSCWFHGLFCLLSVTPAAVSSDLSQALWSTWHFSLADWEFMFPPDCLLTKKVLHCSLPWSLLASYTLSSGDSLLSRVFGDANWGAHSQLPCCVVVIQGIECIYRETGCPPNTWCCRSYCIGSEMPDLPTGFLGPSLISALYFTAALYSFTCTMLFFFFAYFNSLWDLPSYGCCCMAVVFDFFFPLSYNLLKGQFSPCALFTQPLHYLFI